MITITINAKPDTGKTVIGSLLFSYLAEAGVRTNRWTISEDLRGNPEESALEYDYNNTVAMLDEWKSKNDGTLNQFSFSFTKHGIACSTEQTVTKCMMVIDVFDSAAEGSRCDAALVIAYLRERLAQEGFMQIVGHKHHSFSWLLMNAPQLLTDHFRSEVIKNEFHIQEQHTSTTN